MKTRWKKSVWILAEHSDVRMTRWWKIALDLNKNQHWRWLRISTVPPFAWLSNLSFRWGPATLSYLKRLLGSQQRQSAANHVPKNLVWYKTQECLLQESGKVGKFATRHALPRIWVISIWRARRTNISFSGLHSMKPAKLLQKIILSSWVHIFWLDRNCCQTNSNKILHKLSTKKGKMSPWQCHHRSYSMKQNHNISLTSKETYGRCLGLRRANAHDAFQSGDFLSKSLNSMSVILVRKHTDPTSAGFHCCLLVLMMLL